MDRNADLPDSQALSSLDAIAFASTPEQDYAPLHKSRTNDAANRDLDVCEQDFSDCEQPEARLTDVDELLAIQIWKPAEPQFCRAICAHYGVKPRTVQKWFDKIAEACPWFSESELRLPDDRYTPLCVELMGDYRASGLIARKWSVKIAERFTDRVAAANAPKPESSAIHPDVLPPMGAGSQNGDRSSTGGSLVPTGNSFLAALEEEEAELLEIEAKELRLLGRMGEGLSRLTHASSQWDRANQLRKQRLLRQTRLEAASLAVELEEEFENTLRETQYQIQRGNIPVPGKPPSESPQSQSA